MDHHCMSTEKEVCLPHNFDHFWAPPLGPPPKFFDLEVGFESRRGHFCAKVPEYFRFMCGGAGVLGVRVPALKPLSRRGNSHFSEFWLGVRPKF